MRRTEALEFLAAAKEVSIETTAGGVAYRTTIWVVVDDGAVFVRSYHGDAGRWYRRALANPAVTVIASERRIPMTAHPAVDDDSIARATRGFIEKYPKSRSRDAMVLPEILHTTLRLDLSA